MKKINPMTTAVCFGLILSGFHLIWALMVLFDWAQMMLDWIFYLHFLDNPYFVNDFEMGKAISLVVVTFAVGYLIGWVTGIVWNFLLSKGKK